MDNLLSFFKEYGQLINFTMFAVVIGWLFRVVQQYRTTLKDKHDLELTAKDGEIKALQRQLEEEKRSSERYISLLQLGQERLEKIFALPPEEQLKQLDEYRRSIARDVKGLGMFQSSAAMNLIDGLLTAGESAFNIWLDIQRANAALSEEDGGPTAQTTPNNGDA